MAHGMEPDSTKPMVESSILSAFVRSHECVYLTTCVFFKKCLRTKPKTFNYEYLPYYAEARNEFQCLCYRSATRILLREEVENGKFLCRHFDDVFSVK